MVGPTDKDVEYKQEQKKFFNEYTIPQVERATQSADPFERFFKYIDTRRVRYSEDAIENLVQNMKGSRLLEAGCGTGPLTQLITTIREDLHVVALDMSLENVKIVRDRLKKTGTKAKVTFVVGDGEALPFRAGVFDAATVIMVLHHTYSPQAFLCEIGRVTKSKSKTVLVELTSDNPIINITRRVFHLAPRFFKSLFAVDADVVNEAGQVALITHFSADSLKNYANRAGLHVVHEERHVLVLFTLYYLSRILSFMSRIFSESHLVKLYSIENYLLKNSFLKRFGGVVSLWMTKN